MDALLYLLSKWRQQIASPLTSVSPYIIPISFFSLQTPSNSLHKFNMLSQIIQRHSQLTRSRLSVYSVFHSCLYVDNSDVASELASIHSLRILHSSTLLLNS